MSQLQNISSTRNSQIIPKLKNVLPIITVLALVSDFAIAIATTRDFARFCEITIEYAFPKFMLQGKTLETCKLEVEI